MRALRRRSIVAAGICLSLVTACSSSGGSTGSDASGSAGGSSAAVPPLSGAALVAAAQKENVVVVSGPRGLPDFQKVLADEFTAKYGIKVQYTGTGADDVNGKMLATPSGRPYPFDVLVGGYDTLVSNLQEHGALQSLEPLITDPDDSAPSKWDGGSIPWDNSAHTGIGFLRQSGQYFYFDTSKVDIASIKSYRDLLDPKFHGKILLTQDPREDGTGASLFGYMLKADGLGESYVRDLLTKQDVTLAKDDDDADARLKKPQFLLCICNNSQGTDLLASFHNFRKLDPHQLKEGTNTTSSFANLAVPARVAHPNAMKLYVNWLLSKQTALTASKATGLPSARADVATDFIPSAAVPDTSWPSGANESAEDEAMAAEKLATEILGPQ